MMREGKTDCPPAEDPGEKPATLSSGMATLLRGNNGGAGASPAAEDVAEAVEPAEHPGIAAANQAVLSTPQDSPSASSRIRDPLDPDELATRRLYQASLLLADLVLLSLATWLVVSSEKPLGVLEVAGTVLVFLLGAWLACLAFWMEQPDPS